MWELGNMVYLVVATTYIHLFADRFVDGAFVFNFTSFVSQVRDPKVLGSEHERHLGVRDVHDY